MSRINSVYYGRQKKSVRACTAKSVRSNWYYRLLAIGRPRILEDNVAASTIPGLTGVAELATISAINRATTRLLCKDYL